MKKNRKKHQPVPKKQHSKPQPSQLITLTVVTSIISFALYKYLNSTNLSDTITSLPQTDLEPVGSTQQLLMQLASLESFSQKQFPYENRLNELKKNHVAFFDWLNNFQLQLDDDPLLPDSSPVYTTISTALKHIAANDSFFPNLMDPTLQIVVCTPEKLSTVHAISVYSPKDNQIGLPYHTAMSVKDYVIRLRNEFFSHQVVQQNRKNKIQAKSDRELGLPFLKKNGKVDKSKLDELLESFKEFSENAAHLLSLLEFSANDPKVNDLMQLAEDYYPIRIYLSNEGWQSIQQTAQQHGRLLELSKYKLYVYESRNKRALKKYISVESNAIFYTFSNPQNQSNKNKAYAIINDIIFMTATIKSDPSYTNSPLEVQAAELASFYAQFDSKLLQFLAPKFYNFMTKFFSEGYESNLIAKQESKVQTKQQIKMTKDHEMYKLSKQHFFSDSIALQKKFMDKELHRPTQNMKRR